MAEDANKDNSGFDLEHDYITGSGTQGQKVEQLEELKKSL